MSASNTAQSAAVMKGLPKGKALVSALASVFKGEENAGNKGVARNIKKQQKAKK